MAELPPPITDELVKEIAVAFGSSAREWRRAAKLTQAQLAKKSGISRATIAGIEGGTNTNAGLETFIRLGHACGRKITPASLPMPIPE